MNDSPASLVSNVRWVGVSQITRVALQLVGIAILSRMLPSSDFGLLAMATVATTFAVLLRDMGTSHALIQKEDLSDELVDTVFWFNIVLGIFLGLLIAIVAPLAAIAFREPRLEPVLLWLSLVFPISSTASVHQALLERASKFKKLAWLEISSALAGLIVAVIFAVKGAGVYSLVAQSITIAAVSTTLLWIVSDLAPKRRWNWRELHGLRGFSGNLVGFNVINYFLRNSDTMLIGRFLGSTELGFYNMAYRIMLFPLQNLTFVLNRALLPSFSRDQKDRKRLSENYMRMLGLIAVITAPLMAGLWALREPFVLVVLGEDWLRVADVIAWLSVVGFLQSLGATTGTVLVAVGRTDVLRNLGLLGSTVILSSFVVGLYWGIVGVAAAYCIASIIWFYFPFHFTFKQIDGTFGDLLRAVRRQVFLALCMMAVILLGDSMLTRFGATAAVQLAVLIPLGVVFYLGAARLFMPDLLVQLLRVVRLRPIE